MRADMFKLIVERPRWGAGHAPAVKLKKDRDKDRKFVGLKRHVREKAAYSKALNENLAPLVRYLRKQRGRLWNDVYSEICAGLDTGSTVKMHVRMHLEDFVISRISTGRHGELIHEGREIRSEQSNWHWHEFYVDPEDGILKDHVAFWKARGQNANGRRPSYRRVHSSKTSSVFRWIENTLALIKLKGIWYFVKFDERPEIDDVGLLDILQLRDWREHPDWNVVLCKQLSKRDLKRHFLENYSEDRP